MNYWSVLEIAPTNEISEIKKAYAKKLRISHPEDDPEGFQSLREAYEFALKDAKNVQLNEEKNTSEDETTHDLVESNHLELSSSMEENLNHNETNQLPIIDIHGEVIDDSNHPHQFVYEFIQKVEVLYQDFFSRIEMKNWEELLRDDIMWDLNYREQVNHQMLLFLMEHHHFPKAIWHYFNDIFNWNDYLNDVYDLYPETFIDYISFQLRQVGGLRFTYFKKEQDIDYEAYLDNREKAYFALRNNKLKDAINHINLAYQIYPYDPDLLCLKGEYYSKKGELEIAAVEFQKAIQLNPNDAKLYFNQVKALLNNGKTIAQSIPLFEAIVNIFNQHTPDLEDRNNLHQIASVLDPQLKENPLSFKLRHLLSHIYELLGDFENSKKVKVTPMTIMKEIGWPGFFFAALLIGAIVRALYLL